jgi:hypothetical protein
MRTGEFPRALKAHAMVVAVLRCLQNMSASKIFKDYGDELHPKCSLKLAGAC